MAYSYYYAAAAAAAACYCKCLYGRPSGGRDSKKRKQFICGWEEKKKLFIKATIERNTHAYNVRVHNIIWQEISGR